MHAPDIATGRSFFRGDHHNQPTTMLGHAAALVSPQRTGKIKNSKYVYSFIGPLASSLCPRKRWKIKFGLMRLRCRSLPIPSILLCGFENEVRVTDCVSPAAAICFCVATPRLETVSSEPNMLVLLSPHITRHWHFRVVQVC